MHQKSPHSLNHLRIVLVQPTHAGNVGSVARAMRVMGLKQLWIVEPGKERLHRKQDAIALASGAIDVLESIRYVASLPEALADCTLAVAVSAASREFGPPAMPPEPVIDEVFAEIENAAREVALVFGTERTGLLIEEVALCQRVISIPGVSDYHSLNLSQAVQLICYLARRRALAGSDLPLESGLAKSNQAESNQAESPQPEPATLGAIEGLLEHLEQALVAIDYLDPEHPKKLMPRMRRLVARSRLEAEEVHLLRGICKKMLLAAERAAVTSKREV
jgi:tRNA/rRNA methyltransferase